MVLWETEMYHFMRPTIEFCPVPDQYNSRLYSMSIEDLFYLFVCLPSGLTSSTRPSFQYPWSLSLFLATDWLLLSSHITLPTWIF